MVLTAAYLVKIWQHCLISPFPLNPIGANPTQLRQLPSYIELLGFESLLTSRVFVFISLVVIIIGLEILWFLLAFVVISKTLLFLLLVIKNAFTSLAYWVRFSPTNNNT